MYYYFKLGNMARKMGVRHTVLHVGKHMSRGDGVEVPADELTTAFRALVSELYTRPSCVLPSVVASNEPH